MSDEALKEVIEETDVFARVSPEHKMRIVDALRANDEVVAMTGDGVNDAPAIKRADIGVAMGITGTDVAKETADMVLTDDNYASIVSAVEQGRIIYDNIRKFVFFLLSSNVAEIMIIFLATLAGLPAPLTAIQLLWLNLITDGAPALALAMEKGDPDIMDHKPRPKNEPIINGPMRLGIVIQTIAQTGAVLTAFCLGLLWELQHLGIAVPPGMNPLAFLLRFDWRASCGGAAHAETMAFMTLSLCELFRAYTVRSERASIFTIGVFSNKYMQYAVGLSIALLLLVCAVPFLQDIFNTHFMSAPGMDHCTWSFLHPGHRGGDHQVLPAQTEHIDSKVPFFSKKSPSMRGGDFGCRIMVAFFGLIFLLLGGNEKRIPEVMQSLRKYFTPATAADEGDRRMVLVVLGFALAADLLMIAADISRLVMLFLGALLLVTLALALRGILWPAGVAVPIVAFAAFTYLIFQHDGLRDTAVFGLVMVIIGAGLLTGRRGTVAFGVASVVVIIALGIMESSGRVANTYSAFNTFEDYLAVCIAIVLITALQWAVITRLKENIRRANVEIDERRRVEESLRASEARYRLLIEEAPLGIVTFNDEALIEQVNPAACAMSGLSG